MLSSLLISCGMVLTVATQIPEVINDHVAVYRGLEYVAYADETLELDLYVPRGLTKAVPAIVVIPGGGMKAQSKENFAKEAQILARAGFVAASISYRGRPNNTFPSAVHDTKAAVRFLRANASTYHIDTDAIGAFGQSAGGYLTGLLAVSADVPELEGTVGNTDESSRVQAAVCFAGVFDFVSRLRDGGQQTKDLERRRASNGQWIGEPFSVESELWKFAAPISHLSNDDPPLLLVHCKDDTSVPVQQSVQMHTALHEMGDAHRLLVFEEGGHGIRSSPIVSGEAFKATIAFFREHLSK